jgi:hypothetical protein
MTWAVIASALEIAVKLPLLPMYVNGFYNIDVTVATAAERTATCKCT